ncbi:MAG: flagellar assembly peptidoglycan hydrolase FlgJ [Pseudomonadaceae bacterium]|nr:flagellar assembly peptidoglycan hydrolase FlgJ [Pseudomonadaceae bacterium]
MSISTPDLNLGYADYNKLPGSVKKDDPAALQKAAEHFESLFIDMWLKSAREANQVFGKDNFMNSSEMTAHQEMLDHEMAAHLSQQGGIGLAPIIVAQLSGKPLPMNPQNTKPIAAANLVAEQTDQALQAGRKPAFSTPEEFVRKLKPIVASALADSGLPVNAVLGQAALETGWGRAVIADPQGRLSHNLFGIKDHLKSEDSIAIHSKEFEHGRWVNKQDNFRAYPDWTASVKDYVATITQSPRYAHLVEKVDDALAYLSGLQDAGYATDPNYAEKIASLLPRVENGG